MTPAFLPALIMLINATGFIAEASRNCNGNSEVDTNFIKIMDDVRSTNDIELISGLIDEISTNNSLFCEQNYIIASGLVAKIYTTNFFNEEMVTYTVLGKEIALSLTFDKKVGNFIARYSGVRTRKTDADYQLTIPEREDGDDDPMK